ncbi:MAG: cyclophilin-like fold protein [Anaerolineae bacterium]
MRKIEIVVEDVSATAVLAENRTAEAIWDALPFTGQANRWGDEIYFETPVQLVQADDARALVEPGELGYWPMGRAFCIFWGPTPASEAEEPRAYSPVNVFGRLEGDPAVFDGVQSGAAVRVEQA